MSGSSIWKGFVRFDEADLDNGESVGALGTRRLLNNLQHQADSFGRVLIAYPPVNDGYGLQRENSTETDLWTVHSVWGPFAMSVIPGKSYKVRFRIYGRLLTAGSLDVYVRLLPNDSSMVAPAGEIPNNNTDGISSAFTVTNTGGAWLTGDTELQLTQGQLHRMWRTRSTLNQVSGDPRGLRSPEAGIGILLGDTAGKLTFELGGLYVAEVYGDAG